MKKRFQESNMKPKNLKGPIETLFGYLESRNLVEIWIVSNTNKRFKGVVRGFDEWMNVVIEQAQEINQRTGEV